jgi:hypothetical protein
MAPARRPWLVRCTVSPVAEAGNGAVDVRCSRCRRSSSPRRLAHLQRWLIDRAQGRSISEIAAGPVYCTEVVAPLLGQLLRPITTRTPLRFAAKRMKCKRVYAEATPWDQSVRRAYEATAREGRGSVSASIR